MNVRLYEREAAVEAIRQLLDAAIDGHGGSVFVVAAAGLGKTSVLQTAATAASGRFDVRAGGGDAVEATLPYGLIGQVLGDEEEPDALASSAETGDLPAAHWFYTTLRRIRRAAAARPVLLALDDLHWSDPAGLPASASVAGALCGAAGGRVVSARRRPA